MSRELPEGLNELFARPVDDVGVVPAVLDKQSGVASGVQLGLE